MAIQNSFPAFKPTLLLDFAKTKRLDPRITFTRTTTATYYDGDTVAKAEENLLRNSQVFSYDISSWNNNIGSTITSSTEIAPDGTATATKFTANNGVTTAYIGTTNTGVTVTNYGATINLSTGAIATAYGTLNGSITATEFPTGSGWYRIVVTQDGYTFSFYAKAAEYTFVGLQVYTVFRMHACNQSGSTTLSPAGDGTKGILIWGAQMEYRSSVTAYTATTTQPITNYIPVLLTAPAGAARFNHNPVTEESLGLLIEEQRTNLVTYSADFSNAAWIKARTSITSNTIVAPDGTLTGDKLVEDTTASNTHFIEQTASITNGTTYTFSVYAKAAERTSIVIQFNAGTTYSTRFNLSAGTVIAGGTGTASIQSVGNAWYRCSLSAASTATGTGYFDLFLHDGSSGNYTGNGYAGVFIWGAQLEAGAFPTSYIPTVAATVTRNADAASMTGSNFTSWFNNAEGTLYAEGSTFANASASRTFIQIDDTTTSNRIMINRAISSSIAIFTVTVAGVAQADIANGGAIADGSNAKMVGAYQVNNFAFSFNANSVSTDTSGTIPVVRQMLIGSRSGATNFLNGTIKKLAYYPLRVTNAQLQALTS